MSSSPQSTGTQGRAPLWYCHECQAEMRPLMEPDPHCASCHGTFVEMLGDGGDDDPRSFARENETTEHIENLFLGLAGFMAGARSPRPTTRNQANFPPQLNRFGDTSPGPGAREPAMAGSTETGEQRGMRWSTPEGGIHVEFRSGVDTGAGRMRTWAYTTGGGPQESQSNTGAGLRNAANLPTNFPEFVTRRVGGDTAPSSPRAQTEIETPFGPMSPEASARLFDSGPGGGGARHLLMQYLLAMMTGQSTLLFTDGDGSPFGLAGDGRGPGAFGDYVFTQEGLDRIVTELMEAAAAQHRPNPAPEDMIEKLPRTDLTDTCDLVKNGQSCAICTEYFAPQDPTLATSPTKNKGLSETAQGKAKATDESNTSSGVAIELPCHHAFHDDCIITWLKTSGTCPVCRYALVEQPNLPAAPGAPGGGAGSVPTSPSSDISDGTLNSTSAPSASDPPPPIPPPFTPSTPTPFTPPSTSTSPRSYPPPPHPPPSSQHQRSDSSASATPQAQAHRFFQATGGPLQTLQNIFGGLFHDSSGARPSRRRNSPSQSSVRRNSTEGEGRRFEFRRSRDGQSRDVGGGSQQRRQQQQRPNGGASGSGARRHLPGDDLD